MTKISVPNNLDSEVFAFFAIHRKIRAQESKLKVYKFLVKSYRKGTRWKLVSHKTQPFFSQERQSMPALTNTYTAVWRKRDASLEKEHFLSIFCRKVRVEYRNCVQPKTRPPTDGPNKWVTLDSVGRSQIHQKSFYRFQDCREIKAHLMAVSHETFRRGRNALVVFHVFCLKSEGKLHSNLSKD